MNLLQHRRNVYSQNGEDGIVEAILDNFRTLNHWCVEFGAWDGVYLSNTRNLIQNKGYRAVLMEPNSAHFCKLKDNIKDYPGVVALNSFVGFSGDHNLDHLLSETDCPRDFDFLSIDVDGNDIHIWRAVSRFRPKLVCIEYNPNIPTEVIFEQPADQKIRWGCSLAALEKLAREKNYELVCANEYNAFFVVSEYFPQFSLTDNSARALRPNDAPRNMVFFGFDGTLLLSGNVVTPWHELEVSQEEIQPIPVFLRKYPPDYNFLQRAGFKSFRLFRRIRKRIEGW
jgi:hypothetical protein